jgi:Ca-activated chloride channel family protein
VNARLLDRVSGGNSGTSTYVKPDEDIETYVARFYARLTSPVLADIGIEFDRSDVNRVYPRDIPDLFEGGQLIVAGRYRESGRTTLRLSGRVGEERRRFEFPVELAPAGAGSSYDFVERLWAVRRVGFIIDQIDLHGKSKELVDELVALSTRYGILTPYTSFLADERVQLHARAANAAQAGASLGALADVNGERGVEQRAVKQYYLNTQQAAEPAAAAPTPGPVGQTGARSGLMGGGGFGGAYPYPARPAARPGLVEAEKSKRAETVRQVGAKTFYYKDNGWLDADVTPEEADKATTITQFSDPFFDLTRAQSAEQNRYLTFSERVTVKLAGRVYRIEPGAP